MLLIFKLIMNKKAAQEKYKVSCLFSLKGEHFERLHCEGKDTNVTW